MRPGDTHCMWLGRQASKKQSDVFRGITAQTNCTCCHTETEVADQTFCLTKSLYTHTGPTSPRADPYNARRLVGSHWCAKCLSHRRDSTWKQINGESGNRTTVCRFRGGRLSTRPTKRCSARGLICCEHRRLCLHAFTVASGPDGHFVVFL